MDAFFIAGELKVGKYALVFQKSRNDGHIDIRRGKDGSGRTVVGAECDFRLNVENPGSKDVQPHMAIVSRPAMKDAQRSINVKHHRLRREFGSIVRLYRLDKGQELLREWPYVPTGIIELGFKGRSAVDLSRDDRKNEFIAIGGRVLSCLKNHGSIDTFIKRRTKVVQDLAKVERKLSGNGLFGSNVNPACPTVVHVHGNRIGIVFDKPVPCSRKYVSLGFCPFDAVPAPLEALHEPAEYHTSGAVR